MQGLNKSLAYMFPQAEQTHITDNYVATPPALLVVDEGNNVWTLGMKMERHQTPRGEYAFPVLKNGLPTGELASRIERNGGKIRCFTRDGWKTWTGKSWF